MAKLIAESKRYMHREVVLIECKSNFGSIHNVPEEVLERMKQRWEEVVI